MTETGLPIDAAFFAARVADARVAAGVLGWYPSVILAQWAVETEYGTSIAWVDWHNYAGVSPNGKIARYPDNAAGLSAYIRTALEPFYAGVKTDGATEEAINLGRSPWAAGHYIGGGVYAYAGGALVLAIAANNLVQYDGEPSEEETVLPVFSTPWTPTTTGDAERAEVRYLVKFWLGRGLNSIAEQNGLVAYGNEHGRDLLISFLLEGYTDPFTPAAPA